MKKIFALVVCLLVFCFPLSAFAEGEATPPPVVEEEITNEVNWDEVKTTISGYITDWIMPHIEEISVVITLILTCIYNARKHHLLNKSMATLNNNAITVAQKSDESMSQALAQMETASGAVTNYDSRISELLGAFGTIMDENAALRNEFTELRKYLHTATDANVEFANELAELLALANIPNYKKEEIGKRHLTAVDAIRLAELDASPAITPEEVKENDGEEA